MRYTGPPGEPRNRSKGSPKPSTSKASQMPRRKAPKKGKRRNTSLETAAPALPLEPRKESPEPPVEAELPETEGVPPEQDAGMDNPLESGMADLNLSPQSTHNSGTYYGDTVLNPVLYICGDTVLNPVLFKRE